MLMINMYHFYKIKDHIITVFLHIMAFSLQQRIRNEEWMNFGIKTWGFEFYLCHFLGSKVS
jgi:hypothetical protein